MIELVKPRLRGWIHLLTAPVALMVGIVLLTITPTTGGKVAVAIFVASTVLLFGHSALYHLGTWRQPLAAVLRRLDHANIFLLIAGTYTPLAVILLDAKTARLLLTVVWSGALAGIAARVFWLHAPRWFYTPLYVILGWVALGFLPQFRAAGGNAILWLVVAGGVSYTLGAVVYALKRPDPFPTWFGFHEVFHLATVGGYVCHCVAIFLAVGRTYVS
ncbi:MAG: hemolysin III family protein [Bowdeniella nasicola]|nr:hemolysin III family protein [Bowdeniella nasicola]